MLFAFVAILLALVVKYDGGQPLSPSHTEKLFEQARIEWENSPQKIYYEIISSYHRYLITFLEDGFRGEFTVEGEKYLVDQNKIYRYDEKEWIGDLDPENNDYVKWADCVSALITKIVKSNCIFHGMEYDFFDRYYYIRRIGIMLTVVDQEEETHNIETTFFLSQYGGIAFAD